MHSLKTTKNSFGKSQNNNLLGYGGYCGGLFQSLSLKVIHFIFIIYGALRTPYLIIITTIIDIIYQL